MNYNPRMRFSEQDYHLLKTHQSSGSKPYELSYSTPANGEIGLEQKGWVAKTLNPAYTTNVGGKAGIPVTKLTLSVDNLGEDQNLPVGTQMLVYAR